MLLCLAVSVYSISASLFKNSLARKPAGHLPDPVHCATLVQVMENYSSHAEGVQQVQAG